MLRHRGTGSFLRPKDLFVYECEGSRPPLGDPDESSFLGTWSEHPFYYLFFEQEAGAGFLSWLKKQDGWVLRGNYNLAYDQWQQTSAETLPVGPFLIEMSPGVAGAAEGSDGIVIRIDPGVVFGSGLHGSTRGCLLAISRLGEGMAGKQVVDMGTGTGILAISCGKLGASRVFAVDKNPLAIRTARKNIFLNGMEHRVKLCVAESLGALKAPSELLIMNLEWPALQKILAEGEWLSYRWVILSGFLERQWDELNRRLPSAFCPRHRVTVDGWLTATVSRDNPQ
jgi:ribosomal protein L11 methyltransferase